MLAEFRAILVCILSSRPVRPIQQGSPYFPQKNLEITLLINLSVCFFFLIVSIVITDFFVFLEEILIFYYIYWPVHTHVFHITRMRTSVCVHVCRQLSWIDSLYHRGLISRNQQALFPMSWSKEKILKVIIDLLNYISSIL